jgi:hypothetical protein
MSELKVLEGVRKEEGLHIRKDTKDMFAEILAAGGENARYLLAVLDRHDKDAPDGHTVPVPEYSRYLVMKHIFTEMPVAIYLAQKHLSTQEMAQLRCEAGKGKMVNKANVLLDEEWDSLWYSLTKAAYPVGRVSEITAVAHTTYNLICNAPVQKTALGIDSKYGTSNTASFLLSRLALDEALAMSYTLMADREQFDATLAGNHKLVLKRMESWNGFKYMPAADELCLYYAPMPPMVSGK